MTDMEKKEIIRLRSEGQTFSRIASCLGLPIDTVKAFDRRSRQKAGQGSENDNSSRKQSKNKCKRCGKPIVQSGRPRKFCSDTCRREWWKINEKKASSVSRKCVCKYCGRVFMGRGDVSRKYCGHPCYIKDRFGGEATESGSIQA